MTDDSMQASLLELIERLDHHDMIGYVQRFPNDLTEGFNAINPDHLPWLDSIRLPWAGVLCLGMGGSAASGDFIASLAHRTGSVNIHVHRDYTLPHWFNPGWLVLATSHSGNTEETVAATEAALEQGATVIVFASGGMLAGLAEIHEQCHLIPLKSGQPPRTAFAQILARQLALLRTIGVFQSEQEDHEQAMIERLTIANQALDITLHPEGDIALLASSMINHPIAVLCPPEFTCVATRFKNQMNENAARFVRIGVVPEMNHNEIVAWGSTSSIGDVQNEEQVVLILSHPFMHERVDQRLQWFVAHCPTEHAWNINGEGQTLLEVMLYHCLVMDWLSLTVSFLHGKDPNLIEPIDALKGFLQSVQ